MQPTPLTETELAAATCQHCQDPTKPCVDWWKAEVCMNRGEKVYFALCSECDFLWNVMLLEFIRIPNVHELALAYGGKGDDDPPLPRPPKPAPPPPPPNIDKPERKPWWRF